MGQGCKQCSKMAKNTHICSWSSHAAWHQERLHCGVVGLHWVAGKKGLTRKSQVKHVSCDVCKRLKRGLPRTSPGLSHQGCSYTEPLWGV
eukprot:1161966-Pelagomonas_calceolata.AAC.3